MISSVLKFCSHCKLLKLTECFHKDKNRKDGFQHKCKTCKKSTDLGYGKNEHQREYNQTHKEALANKKKERFQKPEFIAARLSASREMHARYPLKRKNWVLMRLYKMTIEDFNRKVDSQEGVCFICKRSPDELLGKNKSLIVDHNHACCPGSKTCGECVRDLLCTHCNTALGLAGDSVERLEAMIAYLKRHGSKD